MSKIDEILRAERERRAARSSIQSWLQQIRKRKQAVQTKVAVDEILRHRDADSR